MRRWMAICLGLTCALFFGWLAFRNVDWAAAWAAWAGANWGVLALAPLLMLASVVLRAWRWRLILRDHPAARFGALILAAGIGLGANAVLPGKLGEAVAAHALGRLADVSRIQSLGIVVITRLFDLFVLFALALCASFVLPGAARSVQGFSILVVSLAGVALITPVVLLRTRWGRALLGRLREMAARILGPGPVDYAEKFARGLASAGHLGQLAAFAVSTALLWFVLSLSLLVALRAFGSDMPPQLAPLVMGLIAVSAILPSAPGNAGTFHYFGLLALGLVGVPPGLAAACVITYHALDMLCALTLGAVCGALARTSLLAWRSPAPGVVTTAEES